MPRPQTINLSTLTPYVKKIVPKRTTKKVAMRPGGYPPRYREQGELLSLDGLGGSYALNDAGTCHCINLCQQGDDINMRHGRQITLKSVSLKGHVKPDQTPTSGNNVMQARIALVWDKNPNGVLATPAQIFDSADGHPKLDNRNRFTILKDWYIPIGASPLNANTWAWSQPSTIPINFYKKLNLKTIFKGTDAQIASISTGALLLVAYGVGGVGTPNSGTCTIVPRVRFTDK